MGKIREADQAFAGKSRLADQQSRTAAQADAQIAQADRLRQAAAQRQQAALEASSAEPLSEAEKATALQYVQGQMWPAANQSRMPLASPNQTPLQPPKPQPVAKGILPPAGNPVQGQLETIIPPGMKGNPNWSQHSDRARQTVEEHLANVPGGHLGRPGNTKASSISHGTNAACQLG